MTNKLLDIESTKKQITRIYLDSYGEVILLIGVNCTVSDLYRKAKRYFGDSKFEGIPFSIVGVNLYYAYLITE